MAPAELPHGVGLGQTFQLDTSIPLIAESTRNYVESQPNCLPRSHSDQSLEDPEVGSASELFQCKYCNKKYKAQYELRKHENVHKKPYQCHLCHTATAERKDLHRHFWAHHEDYARANGIREDIRVCPDCGLRTRSDNMSRHRRRKHWDGSSRWGFSIGLLQIGLFSSIVSYFVPHPKLISRISSYFSFICLGSPLLLGDATGGLIFELWHWP